MTKTTIPRNLKKKLTASLENLTPRQAGRLSLILFDEAMNKGIPPNDYPPSKDLDAAWVRRLDRVKQKDTEAYRREVRLFNGYIFLRSLVGAANLRASSEAGRLYFRSFLAWQRIDRLLLTDAFSEVARIVTIQLTGESMYSPPRPASREEYARLTAWAEVEALDPLGEVAGFLTEGWLEGQTFETLSPPLDVIQEYNAAQGEEDPAALFFENEHNRRAWAEAEGPRLLVEVFAGDRDDLEAWVKSGGYVKDADRQTELAKEDEFYDHLVALLEAGELEGGLAVSLRNSYNEVLLEAGTIPAWAALRAVWGDWLYDHGFRLHDTAVIHPKAFDGVMTVYHAAGEGDVEGDDLARLAGDFLTDCKKRPWGRNLAAPKSVDLAALGFFLTTVETPLLLAGEAPDLGRVAWEVFRKSEAAAILGDGEPYPVATVGSLKAKVAGYGDRTFVLEDYYPTDKAEDRRRDLAVTVRLLNSMRVSHRAFTSPKQEDLTGLAGFLGVEFSTPLEEAVAFLGQVFGDLATFRRTYALLSEEYFGGLPLVDVFTKENLDLSDAILTTAEAYLADWLKTLGGPLWNVDTTSLKLVKADVDEDLVRQEVDAILEAVMIRAELADKNFDLGPEEPPAKGKRP